MTEKEFKAFGLNVQVFLSQLKLQGSTKEDREVMRAYISAMDILDDIISGKISVKEKGEV